jgi:hypothetical protein
MFRSVRGVLLAALVVAAGCIKAETTVTWVIDPIGRVSVSILERNVRSDADERGDRMAEEEQFLVRARVHQHPAEMALKRLDASDLKSTILRDKAPFSVLTEGQFDSLEKLGRRWLLGYGMTGRSIVSRDLDIWTWTLTIESVPDEPASDEEAAEFETLLGERLEVFLREGDFLDSNAFTIDADRRSAVLSGNPFEPLPTLPSGATEPRTLTLRWQIK